MRAEKTPPQGLLQRILNEYQASTKFIDLADRTREDYVAKIRIIERKFGDFPLAALTDKRARGVFLIGVTGAGKDIPPASRLRIRCARACA